MGLGLPRYAYRTPRRVCGSMNTLNDPCEVVGAEVSGQNKPLFYKLGDSLSDDQIY
jgi:hypothetical protein